MKKLLYIFITIAILAIPCKKLLSYDSKQRDPFVPLISSGGYASDAYTVNGVSDVRLEGIVWEGGSPLAIVNGEIVKEGDEVGSLKVIKILKDAVVFNLSGEEVTVKLIETE